MNSPCSLITILFFLLIQQVYAAPAMNGRVQYTLLEFDYADSELLAADAASLSEHQLDLRLMLDSTASLSWSVHDQIQVIKSERLNTAGLSALLPFAQGAQLNDEHRLFDFSHVLHTGNDSVAVHRLDRLNLGQTYDRLSWKLGRYAVSWGNGLVYSVMDIFNPFDPASIDKEYKTGDDMLYLQYLFDSGNDLQLLLLPRRDTETGHVESSVSSLAIKYHGLINLNDFDVLVARHYQQSLFGVGASIDYEGLLWRADVLLTHARQDDYISLLTSLHYAWSIGEKPITGFIEYFYSGYGEDFNSAYSLSGIVSNQALNERLQRGEVYTVGKQYLAPGLDIEWHPLLRLSPVVFYNIDDGSYLLQLLLSYEMRQNFSLQMGMNLTQGSAGAEYGGIEITPGSATLPSEDTVFIQMNAYF